MNVSRHPELPASVRLAPVEAQYASMFCFAVLTMASAMASFAFACATPFAAYAVIAAAMLPMRPALLVAIATWLVNQAVGFEFLHYPMDTTTIAWGFVMGGAMVAATAAAFAALNFVKAATPVALGAALIAAYAAYELALFAATPWLGGADAFTTPVIGYVGMLSVPWTVGLIAVCEIVRLSRRSLATLSGRH